MANERRRRNTIGPEARVIGNFGNLEMVLQIMDDDSEFSSHEIGKDVSIYIRQGRGSVGLNLTVLTRPELDAVGAMFATALGLAEEVCEARDDEAARQEEAGEYEDGEYLRRVYRRVPELLIRNGEVYQYDQELQLRPSWVARMDEFNARNVKRSLDVPGRKRALLDDMGSGAGVGTEDGGT